MHPHPRCHMGAVAPHTALATTSRRPRCGMRRRHAELAGYSGATGGPMTVVSGKLEELAGKLPVQQVREGLGAGERSSRPHSPPAACRHLTLACPASIPNAAFHGSVLVLLLLPRAPPRCPPESTCA